MIACMKNLSLTLAFSMLAANGAVRYRLEAREADGRSFRYPLMLRSADGTKTKVRDRRIPPDASDEMVRSGYYQFGANQLDVMAGLERILQYLEEHYGFALRE